MVKKRKNIKKTRQRSKIIHQSQDEKNNNIKMNPLIKILLIFGLIIFALVNVGTYGWWAPAGAIIIGIIIYLFFLESKGIGI